MYCFTISNTSLSNKLMPTMKTKAHVELPTSNWSPDIGVNIGSEHERVKQIKNNLKNETQYNKYYGSIQKVITEETDVAKIEYIEVFTCKSKYEKPCTFSQNSISGEGDQEESEYIDVFPYSVSKDMARVHFTCMCNSDKKIYSEIKMYLKDKNHNEITATERNDEEEDYMDALPYFKGQEYMEVSSFTSQGNVIKRMKNFAIRRRDGAHYTKGRPSLPEINQNFTTVLRRCFSEVSTKNENILFTRTRTFCLVSKNTYGNCR